jgi:hypothetical protein
MTIRKLLLGTVAAVLAVIPTTVYARDIGTPREAPFDYSCKVGRKTYQLLVDEDKKVLEWRGKKYRIVFQPDCAKYGWYAEGNGAAFNFCTATQGGAYFDMVADAPWDGVQCNLVGR